MKKLYLLIPALVLSLFASAAVINITPTSPYNASHDNLRLALYYATAGDEIVLADGTYLEKDDYLYFNKDITVRAAEGASPIIDMYTYAQIKEAANVRIEGLKFNGAAQGSYSYYFRFYDNSTTSLILEGCEFYNVKNYVLYGNSSSHTNSLIINNCYFHDNVKNAIYFEASGTIGVQTCDRLEVRNTTIANTDALTNYTSTIDIRPYGSSVTDAIKVIVDHCTFYNNPTINTDHSAIRPYNLSDVTISNCIFAHPTAYNRRATCCYGGSITNCLTYNLTCDASRHAHRQSDGKPSLSGNFSGNPLFVDAANNDFTMHNASVARREDGSIWGDPRWVTEKQTIAIPARLNAVDAILSDTAGVISATVEDASDSIVLKLYPGGSYYCEDREWAKWKVSVSKTGYYNFTAHVFRGTSGDQKFEIKLLNSDESSTLKSYTDENMGNGEQTISTGTYELTAGNNYVVKVRTLYNWAKSKVLFVDATYEGGAIIAVPDTLKAVEALKSERAFVNAAGELRFTDDSHAGYVRDQYGKWRLSVAKAGNYKFTVSANSDNAQAYELTLKNSAETVDIASTTKKGSSNTPLKFALDVEDLAIGNYVLNIRDTTNYSHGRIEYIAVSYEGGAVTVIPGQLLGEDALLYKSGSKYMIRTEEGYLKSSNNSAPTSEWAVWNITATAGTMEVTLNLDPVTSSGHNYRVELYDGEVLKDYAEELASSGLSDAVHSKGDVTLEKTLVIPADGSYTVKLINRTQYSSMILEGITIATYVAPAGVIMTDTDTDIAAWEENFEGDACDVQLNRTILGGMYNTICLPFPVNSTMCKAIYGNDVELYTLGTATISGDILNLQFDEASDIYQGTPVLIKTSTDIVNPLFEGVTVLTKSADRTDGGAVTFRGTFVSKDFHNGDQVLLLVANNMLSYPLSDRTLKGFRAYFEVNNPQASAPIRGARIIAGQNVVTSIDLVEAQTEGVTKVIENGQLIIIRDGVRHNALGVQVQ